MFHPVFSVQNEHLGIERHSDDRGLLALDTATAPMIPSCQPVPNMASTTEMPDPSLWDDKKANFFPKNDTFLPGKVPKIHLEKTI